MPACHFCETETQLHINEIPICLECDSLPPNQRLEKRKARQSTKEDSTPRTLTAGGSSA